MEASTFTHAIAAYLPPVNPRTKKELDALKWLKPPDWVFTVLKPNALTPHLMGLTQCGLFVLHIAATGGYAKATEGCFDQGLNARMVDAIFAEQFDWRYYIHFGIDAEGLKKPENRWRVPIACTFNERMGVNIQCFNSDFITASAQYVIELTRHVLRENDRPVFDAWLARLLDRLHTVAACPNPTKPMLRGDPGAFAAEVYVNHGAPLPFEVLDLDRELRHEALDDLARSGLRNLKVEGNSRLRDPARVKADHEGFEGKPYDPNTPVAAALFASRKKHAPKAVVHSPIDSTTLFPRAKAVKPLRKTAEPLNDALTVMAGASPDTFQGAYLPILYAVSQDVVDGPFTKLDNDAKANKASFHLPLRSACMLQPLTVTPKQRAVIQKVLGVNAAPWALDESHGADEVVSLWLSPAEVRSLKGAKTGNITLEVDQDGDGLLMMGACDGTFRGALLWALGLTGKAVAKKPFNDGCTMEFKEALEGLDENLAAHLSYFADEEGVVALARRVGGAPPDSLRAVAGAIDARLVLSFELQDPEFHVGVYRVADTVLEAPWAKSDVVVRPVYFPVQPV